MSRWQPGTTQGHTTDEQLTLGQHAFELCWSADRQVFSSGVSAPPRYVVQGSVVAPVSGTFASPFRSSCPKFPEFSLPRTDPPVPFPVSESFNSFPGSPRLIGNSSPLSHLSFPACTGWRSCFSLNGCSVALECLSWNSWHLPVLHVSPCAPDPTVAQSLVPGRCIGIRHMCV